MMPQVMISYRNLPEQKAFALSLEQALSDAGIDTWMDVKDIPPLSNWEDEIFKGIIESDYVLLCLSPEYFESETCLIECYVARGYMKRILPVIVPHNEHPEMGTYRIIEYLNSHQSTRGLDHLNILNFHSKSSFGLKLKQEEMRAKLVQSVKNPTFTANKYDAYVSYRSKHASHATQIVNYLNAKGITTFASPISLDIGDDWRVKSWNAMLHSRFHIVLLSPDLADSDYISNELLVMRTKKDTIYIPILLIEFAEDMDAQKVIRQKMQNSKNFNHLNNIQWLVMENNHTVFMSDLYKIIKRQMEKFT
ncbi:MAG: toll/interleukin-1 receptor domain-containing protein [Chloroflexota bacterium]